MELETAARILLDSEATRTATTSLNAKWPDLSVADGYRIQEETFARRLDRGERCVGVKLGLTSRAKQVQMGIDVPIVARLTDAMLLAPGEPVGDGLIHPRAEPEIVFVLDRRLEGPGVTAAQALEAVGSVYGGVEIIDSRYQDFKFTLPDVIADNASAAQFVLGPIAQRPAGLDLTLEACVLEVNGEVVDSATGATVQSHPAQALALAANVLGQSGTALEPGWLVLTGGMTDAVTLTPGSSLAVHFSHLGTVNIGVADTAQPDHAARSLVRDG